MCALTYTQQPWVQCMLFFFYLFSMCVLMSEHTMATPISRVGTQVCEPACRCACAVWTPPQVCMCCLNPPTNSNLDVPEFNACQHMYNGSRVQPARTCMGTEGGRSRPSIILYYLQLWSGSLLLADYIIHQRQRLAQLFNCILSMHSLYLLKVICLFSPLCGDILFLLGSSVAVFLSWVVGWGWWVW